MAKHVIVYFKFKSSMYSVTLKTTVEDITLRMLEERLYKKLMLDESKVELCLRYMPLIVGCEEELRICDDEDLFAYLVSFDRDNRRSLLLVEETSRADELEKLSRVGVSSIGMNYEVSEGNNDAIRCDAIDAVGCDAIDAIGCDAIDPVECDAVDVYVEDGQGRVENDNDIRGDDCMGVTDSECMEMVLIAGETHVEEPYVENCSQVIEEWEDGLGLSKLQEFPSKKAIQEVVDRAAFDKCFRYVTVKSDRKRLVVKCCVPSCKWGFRAAVVPNTEMFCIRNYIGVHKCSRRSQSETSKSKRRGSAQFVATFLNEEYPGKVRTPLPRDIMDLLHRKFGVKVSYSTALRGKNLAISQLRGSSEDSYKMLPSYLYMLEQANPETKTKLKLDEAGKFKYLFIALGACIRGFAVMRKVIIVDATFLKNGYGGVLVFAKAQDPNRHHYPLAIGILDGENKASWTWFFEMLRTVISDSSELVFMSDRNQSLITAVANVFPQAYHGHCIWHLSQNVRQHACNTNKSVVGWRFMELARCYTMTEFESAYASFKVRYPSAYKYVEDNTIKETWARVFFPRDRYNLDTSNSVESMNSVFKEARRYALLPLLDTIIQKFSEWFNQHRKDAMNGSIDAKLVPLVEIHLHNIWAIAEKTPVRELNSYELEFQITDIDDRKLHLVNLRSRSCTCKVFDYEKYPCVHGLAAYLYYHSSDPDRRCGIQIEYQELCSKYYWAEVWAKAYEQTIYPVPHISEWNIPDYVKEIQPIPPIRSNKKGRKEDKRKPSLGERRKRTQNKRRARQNFGFHWLLFGNHRDPNE